MIWENLLNNFKLALWQCFVFYLSDLIVFVQEMTTETVDQLQSKACINALFLLILNLTTLSSQLCPVENEKE